MKFDMTSPCEQCPFRNDLPHGYLRTVRVEQIAESLFNQQAFPCHKTTEFVDMDDDGDDMAVTEDSQACAGAEIFLLKQGLSTQLGRIAERFGGAAKLDEKAPVCGSLEELLAVHAEKL